MLPRIKYRRSMTCKRSAVCSLLIQSTFLAWPRSCQIYVLPNCLSRNSYNQRIYVLYSLFYCNAAQRSFEMQFTSKNCYLNTRLIVLFLQRTVDGKNYWTFEYDLEAPGYGVSAFATVAIGNGRMPMNRKTSYVGPCVSR